MADAFVRRMANVQSKDVEERAEQRTIFDEIIIQSLSAHFNFFFHF